MALLRLALFFLIGSLVQVSVQAKENFKDNEFLNLVADAVEPLENTVSIVKHAVSNIDLSRFLVTTLLSSSTQNDSCHQLRQYTLPATKATVIAAYAMVTEARVAFSELYSDFLECFGWNPITSVTCYLKEITEAKTLLEENKSNLTVASQNVATAINQFNSVLLECVNTL